MNESLYRKKRTEQLTAVVLWWGIIVAVLVMVAGGILKIKIQQHKYGEEVRLMEGRIRELRNLNLELRAQVSSLTSHAQILRARMEGRIALVEISDQYVARMVAPRVVSGVEEELTALVPVMEGVRRR